VSKYDIKPKRRLFESLKSQEMQPNQQIEFSSDGGETVRNLPLYLNSEAEHLSGLVPYYYGDHSDGANG
jgi:hypothetical protein